MLKKRSKKIYTQQMLNILQPHLQQQLQADALVIMMKQHINLYLTYYIGFNASRKKNVQYIRFACRFKSKRTTKW